MDEICKRCFNLPCKNNHERRIRNLPTCKEDNKDEKDKNREEEID